MRNLTLVLRSLHRPQRRSHAFFLKWLLMNAVAWVLLITIAIFYGGRISGPALLMVPLVLLEFVWASFGAGQICWRIEGATGESRKELLHAAKYIVHWTDQIQFTAMLTTLGGLFIILSSRGGNLADRLTTQGGAAFSATFVAVYASWFLNQIRRMIENELDR